MWILSRTISLQDSHDQQKRHVMSPSGLLLMDHRLNVHHWRPTAENSLLSPASDLSTDQRHEKHWEATLNAWNQHQNVAQEGKRLSILWPASLLITSCPVFCFYSMFLGLKRDIYLDDFRCVGIGHISKYVSWNLEWAILVADHVLSNSAIWYAVGSCWLPWKGSKTGMCKFGFCTSWSLVMRRCGPLLICIQCLPFSTGRRKATYTFLTS